MGRLSKWILGTAMAGISLSLTLSSCRTANVPLNTDQDVGVEATKPAARNQYEDGSYEATGKYGSLPSSITVTLSLEDDVIENVKVTTHATNPTSLGLQQRFAAAVPAVVIGKRIDEVNVGRLAGSSGTPNGFNHAIEQIREKALIEK